MKEKYLLAYMDMAERFAETSEAKRLKVAAFILKNDSILSMGINGSYPGWETNQCETADNETEWYVRHAESASLDKMLLSHETTKDSTMIVTHAPCRMCSLRIKEAGIKKVYYRSTYRDNSGVEYLQKNNIEVYQI